MFAGMYVGECIYVGMYVCMPVWCDWCMCACLYALIWVSSLLLCMHACIMFCMGTGMCDCLYAHMCSYVWVYGYTNECACERMLVWLTASCGNVCLYECIFIKTCLYAWMTVCVQSCACVYVFRCVPVCVNMIVWKVWSRNVGMCI